MRKTSKLPEVRMSTTRILAVLLALAVVLGAVASVLIYVNSNRTISELEARIARLEGTPAAAADSPAAAYAPDEAAAEYSGGVITVAEASQAYGTIAAYYEMLGSDPAEYEESAKREVIDSLVEDRILENKAKEYGVYDLTADQKAELEKNAQESFDTEVEYYLAFRIDDSLTDEQLREDTVAYLADNGITVDGLYEQAAKDVWRENLRAAVVKDVSVSEEDVRAYYDNQVETAKLTYATDFEMYELDREFGNVVVYNPAGVRTVQAILIPFDSDQVSTYIALEAALENGETDKQAEIDALYAQIMPAAQAALDRAKAGEDFTALMDECGADENMKTEPVRSTGYYVSADSTVFSDSFVSAAMALQSIGDISGPVLVDSGIYILRYATDVAEGEVPYETVSEALTDGCLEEKRNEIYNDTVDAWMADAGIVYHLEKF